MTITVTNKGFTKEGYCEICCKLKGRKSVSPLNAIYFGAVLNCLRDADRLAFMSALDALLESELEQLDDKK